VPRAESTIELGAVPLLRAFPAWYRSTWPKLVGALVVVTGDRAVAEDVASEAMLRMYERWERGEVANPTAWVHAVAINLARRRARRVLLELRQQRAVKRVAETTPSLEPALWEAVAALPRQQRTAVALRYIGDLTEAEIAAAMGRSTGTVAATLSNARGRLRDTLGPDFTEEPR
jgi:RNA polymerase sigma-70 factor (ECF subfamily)